MKKRHLALILGLILCAVGLGGWVYQLIHGLAVTGLRNPFSWGLYMGTFEFFIGVSSGGMLLFSIAYLFHVEGLKPYAKLGAVASLGSVVAAGVIILVDLGQPFRVLQMLLTPNLGSPLFWDVVVLGLYAVLCLAAVLVQCLPDTKKNKDNRGARLVCGKRSRALSFVALPFIAVMNAVTTLMFAVQNSREWWHSALLPADSVAVAAAVGLSFMLLVCLLADRRNGSKERFQALDLLAKIIAAAILVHLGFTVLELVPIVWANTAEGKALLDVIFRQFGLLYALELILPLLAMAAYATKAGRASAKVLGGASVLVVAGTFIHRLMLLLPAFSTVPLTFPVAGAEGLWSYPIAVGTFTEGVDVFTTSWHYVPTLIEWAANLLPFGLVLVVIAGAMVIHPMLPAEQERIAV